MSKWLQDFFQYKAIVEANLTVTSAATVQQYYKYTYESTVYVGATSGTWPTKGLIQFNNADTSIVTECALANLTNEVVDQGIGSYIAEQPAGVYMHVRSTQSNKFGIYKIAASPASRTAHKYFAVTVVNGLALNDGDEVTVSFSSNANCVWDATNETITANGVSIAPNVLAVDTISDALSTVTVNATNHRKEFAVLDPGGNSANTFLECMPWNLIVDNTLGRLRQLNGLSDFAINNSAYRYYQPAANASGTPTTDSTILAGRTRATLTAHGLTALDANFPTYLINQTTQNGWTANEKVKLLSIVDANTLILDKTFSTLTGALLPDFYLITETMPIITILNPPLRAWSELIYKLNIQFPNTAGTKTLVGDFGGTTYWGGASVIFGTGNRGVTRTINIKNRGSVSLQTTNTLANSNSGIDGTVATGAVTTSAVNTSAATTFQVTLALSAAADYVDVMTVAASCRW